MIFSKQKSQLGVDIGTSNIKLVELRPTESNFALSTYGIASVAYNLSVKDSGAAITQTAGVIRELVRRCGVTTNKAVASLPNNVVFTSVIELPKIPENELKKAVEFEAKKYVPLPLEEVALSWSILAEHASKEVAFGPTADKQKILLTAVPSLVIDNYVKMFHEAGLEPQALEIESLALIRSVIGDDTSAILLIDVGAKSTSVNVVDNGYLRFSKSLTVGGDTITQSLAQSLSVNFARAEQFKKDFGMTAAGAQIPQVIRPVLDMIKNEATQLINLFESHGNRMNKIIFSGAGSRLPGLSEYFSGLGKPISLAQPWGKVTFPENVKPVVEPLGINLAVALGLAMRLS
ncbi:MAG: type IV pilus assembly protein PilM [Candidatus Doudnabacteria bacterium]|nr:type IV pilus assembly protein PilM [Candidatus Doudnabacteria bacterium]